MASRTVTSAQDRADETSGSRARATEPAAVWVDVEKLKPWIDNPRKNDATVASVVDSIRRFGFGAPVLARLENGEIIAGHTRIKAALHLGMRQVPVRYLDLDEAEAHLLALADNKLGESSSWDDDLLAEQLREMEREDARIAGFDGEEIDKILAEPEEAVAREVDVSELRPEFWISIRGPLPAQPDVLDRLREGLAAIEGLDVVFGVTGDT